MYKLYYIQNNKKRFKIFLDYSTAKYEFDQLSFEQIPCELESLDILTVDDVAYLLGKTARYIRAEIEQDQSPTRRRIHYPNAERCKCGRKNWLIPIPDVIPLLEAKRKKAHE